MKHLRTLREASLQEKLGAKHAAQHTNGPKGVEVDIVDDDPTEERQKTAKVDIAGPDGEHEVAQEKTLPKFAQDLKKDFPNPSVIQFPDTPSCPYEAVNWEALRARVAQNPTGRFIQKAIYPADSILHTYIKEVQNCCESADIFILSSIQPVVNALLDRRVYVEWETGHLYPNSFHLIIGTAGMRKTSAIRCAKRVAFDCLPPEAFLSIKQSVEALFDEYHPDEGGRPDKIMIVEEGNVLMSTWAKSDYGARVAAEFLQLYDCCELTETFKRNKDKESGPKRRVPETSTSIVIGGTFGVATFPLQQIKEGIERRFLYGVAETIGRTLLWPERLVSHGISELFKPLLKLSGPIQMPREGEIWDCWADYQIRNRQQINEVGADDEVLSARLASCPAHVLKTAITFQACRAIYHGLFIPEFTLEALEPAIEYVEEHMRAAKFLDQYSQRKAAQEYAEVILATVRKSFQAQRPDTIYVTRTDLTRKFCPNIGRAGALTPQDLYLRIIPELERQGEACLALKRGKFEVYAFRTELTL
jgi:hypothetical protein